jgi:hypothetical protein
MFVQHRSRAQLHMEAFELPHAEVPAEGGPRSTGHSPSSTFWMILRGRPGGAGPAPQDESVGVLTSRMRH